MPKNKSKNAFYFFMLDWKKRAEARGHRFTRGLQDVQADLDCSREWQCLSKEQRLHYESLARNDKKSSGNLVKRTALGESLCDIEWGQEKKQAFEQNMYKYIDYMVSSGWKNNNLQKLKFYFIHVNWFFVRQLENNKCDYFPAEFAVSEFSLEKGTENIYHVIINEPIPLGFKREAMETSQRTHQIPTNLPEGENNYSAIFDKLTVFLRHRMADNKFPPLFTLKSISHAVQCLLSRVAKAAGESEDVFLVYSLEALFASIRNTVVESAQISSIPLVVAENELVKDVFSFEQGLECDFHKNLDGTCQYCSMSVVKRWGLVICDHCCEYLEIEIIPGVHGPRDLATNNINYKSLSSSMSELSLHCGKSNYSVLSMTGVSEDHRRKVSERTYVQEQCRRNESAPLEIIDYSKFNKNNSSSTTVPPAYERPLRAPKSKSFAMAGMENISLDLNADFPPIAGRGVSMKQKSDTINLPLGRGHGKR